ncbi:hypothetical protein ACSBOB_15875 [Mesorhizobium sp. ASY16-5R]|uniref:hypothetical protein n=1 Tax=Mesorhizobium sp. ASY16-5R TaxID=3445772 RepID=UPI003FA01AC3
MDMSFSFNFGRARAERDRRRRPVDPARDPSNFDFRSSSGGDCQDDKFAAFHSVDYRSILMFNQTK